MHLQGQFQGKEGSPTVVLEAFCDHHLWFWHAVFSFLGSLNEINIWGQIPLQKFLLDGTFSKLDFDFQIEKKLWHPFCLSIGFIKFCMVCELIPGNSWKE